MNTEGTTERVLRLLGLLQRHASWTAAELAAALEVTERCVRRDVARLRSLGYPVEAAPGVGGGYRLGAGTRLPPLLFDDDEAIATAVSLRLASGGTVAAAGEAAVRALAKLDQVMPPRLRAEVRALQGATETLGGTGTQIDPELLVVLARACRDTVRVRFGYTGSGPARADGESRERTVEPVRMVASDRRWYLMAHDVDRDDWRTFRLDRMHDVVATTWRFRPREHPDPVEYVRRAVAESPYRHVARVRLDASAERVRALVPPQVGRVEQEDDGSCVLVIGGHELSWIAVHVALLGADEGITTEILEPAELSAAATALSARLASLAAPALDGDGLDSPARGDPSPA